jgi:hypothetical protein
MEKIKQIYKNKYFTYQQIEENLGVTPKNIHRELIATMNDFKNLSELKKKLRYISKVYRKIYKNIRTLSKLMSEIRKPIRVKYGRKDDKGRYTPQYLASLELLHLNPKDDKKLKNNYKKKVKQKNMKQKIFSKSLLYDMLNSYSNSKKKYEIAVCLLLASGCRPIELFYKSDVTAIDGKTLKIHNIAKQRDNQSKSVNRPCLLDTEIFLEKLKYIREVFPKPISKDGVLQSHITQGVTRVLKKRLDNKTISAYILRSLYGILAHDRLEDSRTVNVNTYISSILGHENLSTSFSYSSISLID